MAKPPTIPATYPAFLAELKQEIAAARIKAALSVNRELVILYYKIGKGILARVKEGWGTSVIDRLSRDLRAEFPDQSGFSPRNLAYMRQMAEAYDEEVLQTVSAKIPWSHNCLILDKVRNADEREWYVRQTFEQGWSHNVLALQIDSHLYHRQGKAVTNFKRTLPEPQSDLAQHLTKDSYVFDFLSLTEPIKERKLERALIDNIAAVILELGKGFAFIGRQYHIRIGRKDYYLDLLFFHYRLRCFVVFELKSGEFKPEYAGKMNFYLSAVDDMMRHPEDRASIGIILCRDRDKIDVEYALRDINKPMGVAEFKVTPDLPPKLAGSLPTVEEINAELQPKKALKRP